MSRTPRTLSRWIHRPHRHTWLPDTRDPEYSAGRLLGGYPDRS
jgi:hypothetical protein